MPPRAAALKRSTRRIIEDEESDEAPDEEQYDDEEEDQMEDAEEDEEVDELEEDEDDYGYGAAAHTTSRTGLKIKLNVGTARAKAGANAGATATSTPGDTPTGFSMPRAKRANKRRIIAPSEDEQDEEDDEEDEADYSSAVPTISAANQSARMTSRQAALAGTGGPVEHVSLEEPPNPRKRKWTEEEIAMRREEAARKRKLKGAQRQEDEKQMIINRLINKGTGKRGRWASKAKDPTPEVDKEADKEVDKEADEEGEEGGLATGAAGEGTEAGEGNESSTTGEEDVPGTITPAPTRGGWRGRGRRGRGARLPPPPVKMHIPVMRWISGMKDLTIEGPSEPVPIESVESKDDKGGTDANAPGLPEKPEKVKPAPNPADRESTLTFSIPPELLPLVPIPPEEENIPLKPRVVPKCAVTGCQQLRKYKVVGGNDPELGACGMAHLSQVQKSIVAT